jgi:hypothetical protein
MNEELSRLLGQLENAVRRNRDYGMDEIIVEARREAQAEVKAMLKELMVRAMVEQAVEDLGAATEIAGQATAPASPPSISALPAAVVLGAAHAQTSAAAGSDEELLREVEAIRRKIAENEAQLNRLTTPVEGGVVSPSPEAPSSVGAESGFDDWGYYVYGIVGERDSHAVAEFPIGVDATAPVYTVRRGGLQALVSKVSLREFGEQAVQANVENPEWLKVKACIHQHVLEFAMACWGALVPMRFCTIYRTEDNVHRMLDQYGDQLVAALAYLEGRQEWGVKVYCDRQVLARHVETDSQETKALKSDMDRKPGGAAYFMKKKLAEVLAREVERVSDEYAQRDHERLAANAVEAVINPLQSGDLTGKSTEMLLNGAYLVDDDRLPAFRAELEVLVAECEPLGFSFEMTGPWPPYRFVNLTLEEEIPNGSVSG